jgi:hypothetical protein
LELEVYLNRLELLQGQIKARLEELKSSLDWPRFYSLVIVHKQLVAS